MNARIRNMLAAAAYLLCGSLSHADVVVKADNNTNLNQTTSWVGEKVPGTTDIATWNAALTASKTYSLGADLSWLGLAVTVDPGGNIAFNSGNALTLGSAGIYVTPNRTVTLNNAVALDADQTWSMSQNTFTAAGSVNTAGRTLTLAGAGTKQFKGAITGGGTLRLTRGGTKFSNGTVASASDILVQNGTSSLTFDATPAAGGAARAANITLRGAGNDSARVSLTSSGVNSADTVDVISGALTIDAGHAYVTASPNAARPLLLKAGSLARNQGGTVLFRGTDLGVSTLESSTAGDANISFTNPPALLGGGGVAGSTTNSILPGAYGDTLVDGSGTGLVTYDSTFGIRLLDAATEYTSAISDGQAQLDNVRYVKTSGSGVTTNTLTANTTINSLSFNLTGTGTNTGVSIIGDTPDRQLVLSSGQIFAQQAVSSATASDAMTLTNLTLNLNGQEGVFLCYATGLNQGNTPAPLFIYAAITNDGGHGVTVGSIGSRDGEVYFAGSVTNTYTGPTTIVSGNLRLSKGTGYANIGIPGDLIMNGGAVLKNSESIPDTADVTLNGGSFYFDTSKSSGNNGHQETIRNLIMNGGAISFNAGKSHRFYINGDATINAGDLKLNTGGDVKVLGTTTLNGGKVLVSLSDSTANFDAFFTLNDLVITNQADGAYAAVVLKANATNKGGLLTIGGDVTVVGNSANTNSVSFDSEDRALAQQGLIVLDGTCAFAISDGAAVVDLMVIPSIANNGITNGALTKTGAGTLLLAGTNTYTGATTVSNGTLAVTGGLASPVTVCTDAVLAGTGWLAPTNATALTVEAGGILAPGSAGAIGTLTVTGNVSFAASSQLRVDVGAGGADRLAVSGTVAGGTVTVDVAGSGSGPWLILSATDITATFTTSAPGLVVSKHGNTEVWLGKNQGTLISVL